MIGRLLSGERLSDSVDKSVWRCHMRIHLQHVWRTWNWLEIIGKRNALRGETSYNVELVEHNINTEELRWPPGLLLAAIPILGTPLPWLESIRTVREHKQQLW